VNFDAVAENLPLYFSGAWTTLQLLLISLSLGLLFAIPLGVLRAMPIPWLSRPIWLYTYVFRGTPMLVQLFLIYYGLAQFECVRESIAWPWLSSAWFCACLSFVLNTCAYTVEIVAGSIRALPHGEIEAAKSLGMGRWVLLRRIVLPSALRRALPAYSNEAIFMLHGTALASIVTIMDLTGAARQVNATYYLPFEAFITAAVFYFLLTLTLVGLFHAAERRWLKPLMPR
jgi:arginine/ornithine transport system permease protein